MVKVHWQQRACYLQIEGVQRVVRSFASVGDVAAVGICACVGALDIADTIAGSPFARQDAAVNIISRRPDPGETEHQRKFVTFFLAEYFANGIGIAPQVFGVVTLNLLAIFRCQQQVLDVTVISVHFQCVQLCILGASNVVA